jgi:hypothetical protein
MLVAVAGMDQHSLTALPMRRKVVLAVLVAAGKAVFTILKTLPALT